MTTNVGRSIQLCYSWSTQAPENKASLTSELLLLLLKLCLCKWKKSDSISSITVNATVGLLLAMNNRKGCQEITSIAISFMDIIFPPNALKCKYLTVVMTLSQSRVQFALISYCYYTKRQHQAEGGESIWRVGYICSVSLGEEPEPD